MTCLNKKLKMSKSMNYLNALLLYIMRLNYNDA